jgi:uncharacterized protein (TIGR02266 family)
MSQDTRKDPRAKIVSLNVRYKSATVDEFIDNHAMDVSKGGIFIKTSTPFPQGTLLKFEIRLAGDQSVIAGVGRVVWKREPANAGAGERAAGMGVKFIKLDDASRAVIDRLAASREDAGSMFTSELENDVTQVDQKAPGGMTGASALKQTQVGLGPQPSAKPTIQGMPAQSAPRPGAGSIAKSTIVGMPAVQQPKEDPKPEAGSSGGFFPAGSGSEADMPPANERTVMKQAAELLEEALKEAGGSMDEVGHNPLFDKSATPPPATTTSAKVYDEDAPTQANEAPKPAAAEAKSSEGAKVERVETASLPRPITSQPILASDRAHSLSSSRPAAVSAKSYVDEPEKRTSLLPFVALAVVVLGAGGFFVYKSGMLGGGSTPVDTSTPPIPTPSVTASASPLDSAMAMTDASLAAIPSTDDAGMAAMAKDAGTATPIVTATVKPPAVATYHPPKPKPTATATATDTSPDTTAPTTTATPTPMPTDTATLPTPIPTTTATPTPTPTATTSAKPGKTPDDNPY